MNGKHANDFDTFVVLDQTLSGFRGRREEEEGKRKGGNHRFSKTPAPITICQRTSCKRNQFFIEVHDFRPGNDLMDVFRRFHVAVDINQLSRAIDVAFHKLLMTI